MPGMRTTPTGSLTASRCPICGGQLRGIERVREERVPSTVPDYRSRSEQAPYRRVDTYEVVRCVKDHTFKRSGNGLRGMANV